MNKSEYLLSDECLRERTEDLRIARQAHSVATMDLDNAQVELARVKDRERRLHVEVRAIETAVATAETNAIESIFSDDLRAGKHARAELRALLDERGLLVKAVDAMILRRRSAERSILVCEMNEQTAAADLVRAEAALREVRKLKSLLPVLEAEGSLTITGGTTAALFEEVTKIRARASACLERIDAHDIETAAIKKSVR
jgi:hypothetical protein